MPNVTIKLPAETYRKARIWAVNNETSLSRAFRLFLEALPSFSAIRLREVHIEPRSTPRPPQKRHCIPLHQTAKTIENPPPPNLRLCNCAVLNPNHLGPILAQSHSLRAAPQNWYEMVP